jgi:hypothetical protein
MILSSDRSGGRSELHVEGSPGPVMFPGVMEKVQQVCSLFHDELVVFGLTSPALYDIAIVKLPSSAE